MKFKVRYLALFLLFAVKADSFEWFLMEPLIRISSYCWSPSRLHSWFYSVCYQPPDVICNIAIYADNTTLHSKHDQASDLWQQLELACDLEPDLQDTVDCERKQLVDFNAGKTNLVLFDQSNNAGAIDLKIDWCVLEEKSFFLCRTARLWNSLPVECFPLT